MKVRATDKYEELNVEDRILGRIPKAGEEFEVSEERYKELTETNSYGVAFVGVVLEKPILEKTTEIETAKKEIKSEKAVKKTTKKAK